MMNRDVSYYMDLPYKIEIIPEEGGTGFNVEVPDLKGCVAFGETIEDALQTLTEVKQAWIEIALERGWRIPEPSTEGFKEYSGRFNVRLPRYLHRGLAELAKAEGTSLNQLVVALLAEGAKRLEVRTMPREEVPAVRQQSIIIAARSGTSDSIKPICVDNWPRPEEERASVIDWGGR